jgi:nucleotide-binding universal stress UspA family protein
VQLVVGHDGHPAGEAALKTAIELAEHLQAHLHVVHSVTLEEYGIDPDTEEFEERRDRNLAAERETIATTLVGATVTWSYHEARGDPARQLARVAAATEAAYIIVGSSHRGVLRHLLGGGPVGEHLLHLQTKPVVVVPEPRATRS